MQCIETLSLLAILIFLPGLTRADGLIYQLPDDGAWVKFEVEGEDRTTDGTWRVSVKGTQTVRSVGKQMVDNQPCRWIELESDIHTERAQGQKGKYTETLQLLIPESQLVQGKNPRHHVLKAYRGKTTTELRELDLKGVGVYEIRSLDEILHAPLKEMTKLPATTIETKQDKWKCEGYRGEDKSESWIFTTETRINEAAPFGVVTYKYEKERRRNNESQGMRTMTWKLVDFGKEPKIAAPNAD